VKQMDAAKVQNDRSLYLEDEKNKRKVPTQDMGKDQFLKILVTQLQNQDPLNPMEDKDFVAQMATFSSLEQMMSISKSIDKLVQSQLITPVVQYSHMIGKTVSYQTEDEQTGEKSEVKTSKVKAVSQKEGWAILELENGEKVFADSILKTSSGETKADTGKDEQAPS